MRLNVLREPADAGITKRRTLVVGRGEASVDGASAPFAVMQATLTAVYDRPGITH
jgi:hypothetical protein